MDPVRQKEKDSSESSDAGSTAAIAGSSTSSTPAVPQRTASQSSTGRSAGHVASHRQSFAENLRNAPGSPRSQRHPSFTQAAVQELINHPPPATKSYDSRFAGRDWREVSVGELVSEEDVKWVELDTTVEEATKVLKKSYPTNAVLIREDASSKIAVSTFDYNDLNTYLLVVVGLANPDEEQIALFQNIAAKARQQVAIPLRDIQPMCRKETLINIPSDENLAKVIEVLGSGIHRILVTNDKSAVVGILSQMRLVEFFWNEGVHFPNVEKLYSVQLHDLGVGTQQIIAVNSDQPLADALTLMNEEGLTSVAVVDNGYNVVGNISVVDVRHLTSAASAPLLKSSCMHFISVILNERGMENGRDSYPVFYVNPHSTLAHAVAKLDATQSHRMWVVESPSPSPSAPATPLLAPTMLVPGTGAVVSQSAIPPPGATMTAVPAASLPGARLSGRLTGVISLSDILNLFAKSTGLNPTDPSEQRARRRRSSSSSVRPSIDSSRASFDIRR